MDIISTSPTGRFQVQADIWEARNSLWVYSPSIWDAEQKQYVLLFKDESWSVDKSVWLSENKVQLTLRKFPGNHRPEHVNVEIDCAAQIAMMAPPTQTPLVALESVLDCAITWV